MSRRYLAIIAAITVSAMILAGLSFDWNIFSVGDHVDASKVYFATHISPAHKRVIELFNKEYKGRIEVIPVNLPFEKFTTNERKELLARSLRSKSDRIDVFAVDLIWVPRFSKWCEPLEGYFTPEEKANILSFALQSCYFESTLVAVPLYLDIGLMYYRRDLLSKLPDFPQIEQKLRSSISWDEFIALRDRVGYRNKPFYVFQADDYEGLVCNYFELIMGQDKDFFRNNSVNLRSTTAKVALQMMADFVHKINISPPRVTQFDENQSYAYMLENDAIFVRGWPNFIESFSTFYPDRDKLRSLGRAALPHFPGKRPASVYGGWNVMVSKFSPRKSAAVEFIKYLQKKETQELLFDIGGYIPTNNDLYADSLYMSSHPGLQYYRTLLDFGFHRPAIVEYTKMSDIISYHVHHAIKGDIPVEQALEQSTAMILSNKVLIK